MNLKKFVRLRSTRAPYTRGGISFRSVRDWIEVEYHRLTDHQLQKLIDDPHVTVEHVEREVEAAQAVGETHIVQAVGDQGLAPAVAGVVLGSPAVAAGAGATAPAMLQPGAVIEQLAPEGADTLSGGAPADSLLGAQGGETVSGGAAFNDAIQTDIALAGGAAAVAAAMTTTQSQGPASAPVEGVAAEPLGATTESPDGAVADAEAPGRGAADVTTEEGATAGLAVEGAAAEAPAPAAVPAPAAGGRKKAAS